MSYRIEPADSKRESFGDYRYRIYGSGGLIAQYWHDFRGDEHGIDFVNGISEPWPVGQMTDFIQGGGPQPLTLSERAVAYIQNKLT